MRKGDLIEVTEAGFYCAAGDFHIDPWQGVEHALITHAHADHARWGSRHYLTTQQGAGVLRLRMGAAAAIQAVAYGEPITRQGVRISLHPAGHILGSAQVRVEYGGEVWVVSGDYKVQPDPTCAPFEPVRCHTFITESTFGLPVYRWPSPAEVFAQVNAWWRANQTAGRASVLFGYALGKAQHLLAGLESGIGPIYTHGAVEKLNTVYRAQGIALPPTQPVRMLPAKGPWEGSLIVAPPSAHGSPWMRKFGNASTGFLSGWMQIRGTRRRKAVDRGFVLSDHADWPGLLEAIQATGAQKVWVTHGYTDVLARRLREQGLDAGTVQTRFEGESDTADQTADQTIDEATGDGAADGAVASAGEGEPA